MIELSFENIYVAGALSLLASLLAAWAEFGKERADVIVVRLVAVPAFLLALVALLIPDLRGLINGILFGGFLLVAFLGGVPGVQMKRPVPELYRKATFIFLGGCGITAAAFFVANSLITN